MNGKQMTTGVIIAGIVSATSIILGVIIGLVVIDITKDGSSEGIIIAALVGLPTFIVSHGTVILANILGTNATKKDKDVTA